MRIVEAIIPKNAEKTILGSREIKLTLDTETGDLTIDAPAMFTDPIVDFDTLKEAIEKLENVYKER